MPNAHNLLPKKAASLWRSLPKRKIAIVFCILVAVTALIGLLAAPGLLRTLQEAKAAKADLQVVQQQVTKNNYKKAAEAAQSAEIHLDQAHAAVRSVGWLRALPFVGRQIKAVERIIASGKQVASGGVSALQYAQQIFSVTEGKKNISLASLSTEQKRYVLQKILESPPVLQSVKSNIDLALVAADEIPRGLLLGPIREIAEPLQENLPKVKTALEDYMPLAEIIPTIAGYPQQKTYLFLMQNNNELRPTGGFIGTYGILKLKDGEITSFYTDNIYNLDDNIKSSGKTTKPDQLRAYSDPAHSEWFMRDGNWSPDFPQASRDILSLYNIEGGKESVDGIIAIDPDVIRELLRLTGDLTVSGTTFTPDNLSDRLEYIVGVAFAAQGIDTADRKNIIGDMGTVLINRVLAYPREKWPELMETIGGLMAEKHILMFTNDNELEQKIAAQPWGGAITQTEGDFLFVVDANMASKKTDQVIQRSINYSVRPQDGKLIATATITYTHTGIPPKETNTITRYRTYTRVYVPAGSTLVSTEGTQRTDYSDRPGEVETLQEYGKTSFGYFTTVEPKSSKTVKLTYQLSDNILQHALATQKYDLVVQKQPGTAAHGLDVDLSWGPRISSSNYEDLRVASPKDIIQWKTDLRQDRHFNASTN